MNQTHNFEVNFIQGEPENLKVTVSCDKESEQKEFSFVIDGTGVKLNEQSVKDDILLFTAAALRRISEKMNPDNNHQVTNSVTLTGEGYRPFWKNPNEFSNKIAAAMDRVYNFDSEGDKPKNQVGKFIVTESRGIGYNQNSDSDKIKQLEDFISNQPEPVADRDKLDAMEMLKKLIAAAGKEMPAEKSGTTMNMLKSLLKLTDSKKFSEEKRRAEEGETWVDAISTKIWDESSIRPRQPNKIQELKIDWHSLLAGKDKDELSKEEYEVLTKRFEEISSTVSTILATISSKVKIADKKDRQVCVLADIRSFVKHITECGKYTPAEQFFIAVILGEAAAMMAFIPMQQSESFWKLKNKK